MSEGEEYHLRRIPPFQPVSDHLCLCLIAMDFDSKNIFVLGMIPNLSILPHYIESGEGVVECTFIICIKYYNMCCQ